MTPHIFYQQVAGIGRRAFVKCPVHGLLDGRHYDREAATSAWEQHVRAEHAEVG